jgi:hypothetical protein
MPEIPGMTVTVDEFIFQMNCRLHVWLGCRRPNSQCFAALGRYFNSMPKKLRWQ